MNTLDEFASLPKGRGSLYLEWASSRQVVLWLDNPDARNAMSIAMMHQLAPIVTELEAKKPSVVVIRGRNHHFCAGGDLKDVKKHLFRIVKGWNEFQFAEEKKTP